MIHCLPEALIIYLIYQRHDRIMSRRITDLYNSTVESLLTDIPNKGHCIKYLSTMDKTKSPKFNTPPHQYNWNLLIEDSLYIVDKPLEFILVPKCPLFGGSTVLGVI